jgi:hypothetical protein
MEIGKRNARCLDRVAASATQAGSGFPTTALDPLSRRAVGGLLAVVALAAGGAAGSPSAAQQATNTRSAQGRA